MFKDERRVEVWQWISQQGIRAFAGKLTPDLLAEAATKAGARVTQNPLCLTNLAWLGVSAAIHISLDFAAILTLTLKILEDQKDFARSDLAKLQNKARKRKPSKSGKRKSKHDPYGNDPSQVNEEAFVQARQRMPQAFWIWLIFLLGQRFQQEHGKRLEFRGFRLLAMDGTCIELDGWKKLRDYFGSAKNASGLQRTQARMVMLQFPHVRMPLCYELCSISQGEASIARRLSKYLQENDLVLVDAGFLSYGLFCDIQKQGAYFAIPLKGKKLRLKTVRRLGKDDVEVKWTPKDSRGQWKKENLDKTLTLRMVTYQIHGYRSQKLLTNVLSPSKVSREDWWRLATDCSANGRMKPGLMHRRWEIETTFRELKVVQGMEANLRGRTPQSIQYEVAGHVVLYLLVRWLMVEAADKADVDPLRISFTNALRELQRIQNSLTSATPQRAQVLVRRLIERVARHIVPYRPGRQFPRRVQSSNYRVARPHADVQNRRKPKCGITLRNAA